MYAEKEVYRYGKSVYVCVCVRVRMFVFMHAFICLSAFDEICLRVFIYDHGKKRARVYVSIEERMCICCKYMRGHILSTKKH